MIVLASGKNLYPEEIEAHYRESEFIKEICVLGLSRPGEPIGERLHAVVVPDEDVLRTKGIVNVQQLVRFEMESRGVLLPSHKRVLTYDIWTEPLPRTTTGKIRRHQIERRLRDAVATAETAEQTLTPEETTWLADPRHASAVQTIATRLKRAQVRPDANLDLDLALDSMERVELLTALELLIGRRVTPETRATIFTVRQLVDAVYAAAPTGATAAGAAPAIDDPDHGAAMWDKIFAAGDDPEIVAQLSRPSLLRAMFFWVILRLFKVVLLGLTRGRTSGQAQLPTSGPCIISPNHVSYLDGFLVLAAMPFSMLRNVFAVGAAEYYQTPLMKRVARFTNVIPVDPDANLESAMRAGATGLRLGKVLMLFPEGERSIDGELKVFKKGASILSAHCNAPIVPVALTGLFELWPRGLGVQWGRLLPWKAPRVRLQFGASIQVARGQYAEGTAALRSAVGQMFDALRRRS